MKQMLLNAEKSFNSSINGKGVEKNLFMKKGRYLFPFIILILFGIVNSNSVNAQLLQQQFGTNDGAIFSINASPTIQAVSSTATYFNNTSPSNSQFNYASAGTGTAGNTQTLTSNGSVLTWSKAGTSTTGAIFRTTQLAATAPTSLIVKADVNFSVAGATNPVLTFYAGQNFTAYVNGTTAPTVPVAGSTVAKFAIQTGTSKWGVTSNSTVATNTSKTLTWVINNGSTATLSYVAPDGTYETVANNTYDLWIGTTKDVNDASLTTTGISLKNFAIVCAGGVETFTLDNILIDPIPTAPSISSPTNISGTGFTANWGAVTGATGYNLDVSTSSSFASFVSGYNNLGVVGTNTQAVTGLTSVGSGTTYYYRARTYNTYSVATNTSGNNFTSPTLGGVSVSNVCAGNTATVSLTGLVASSTNNIVSYSIGGGATQTATVNADVSGNASFSTPTLVAGNNGQNFVILGIANGSAGIIPGSNNSATLTVYSSSGVTFNVSTNPNILQGTTSANLSYTSTGSPDHYTITYAAGAITAGFSNVANTSNSFTSSGTLPITIPGSAASGIYTGTVTAILASNGCSASAPFTITSYYNWTGSAGDNNWATPSNWNPSRTLPAVGDILVFDGKTATLSSIPLESDYQVIIKNSSSISLANGTAATLTISNGLTVDGTSTLTESTNASITIASGATATINGTLNVNAGTFTTSAGVTTVGGSSAILSNGGGTVTGSATTLFFTSGATYTHAMAAGTIPTANWTSSGASLVNITGATSACPSGMGQTFYNLTWNCASQNTAFAFSSAPTAINGTLTVTSTGTALYLQLLASGSTSITVGAYTQTGGTVAIVSGQSGSGTRTLTVNGDFSISGTSFFNLNRSAGNVAAVGQLEVKGNLSVNSGTNSLLVSANTATPTGTILLDGTGNQTITVGSATVFATTPSAIGVTVSKSSGTLSLSSNLTIPGALALTNGTLTIGANTLNIQGSTSGSGLIDATNSSANITFNGAAAQTIAAPFTSGTISNLTMNNTSGGVTLSTPITLTGVLTLTSGALTTDATNVLTVSSTTTVPAGSSSSFIKGPMILNLPANYSTAGAKNFPVGSGSNYYGLVLNNPTVGASASAITVTAFNSGSGGTVDATLGAINSGEYWSLTSTGNFNGASSIKLSSASGSTNTAIAYSTTLAGVYTTLGGSGTGTPLTSTSAVPAGTALYFALGVNAATYTWTGTAADGNWSTATNWSPTRSSAYASDILVFDGSTVPTVAITDLPSSESDYRLTIRNGVNVTLSSSATAALSITNSLSIDATSTLTESTNTSITLASGTTTVNGTLNVNAGTYTSTGVTTVSGSSALLQNGGGTVSSTASTLFFTNGATYTHTIAGGTIPTANWTSSGASTVNITGSTSASPSGMGQTFYHLTWNCANQSGNFAFANTPTINGTLTIVRTGSSGVLYLLPSGTSYSVPSYVQNGGSVAIVNTQGTAGTRTFTVNGNFAIDNTVGTSTFNLNRQASASGSIGVLEVKGNFTASSSTSLLVTSGLQTPSGYVMFSGTGTQTISVGTSSVFSTTPSAIGVTVNKASGSLTLSSDFTIPGTVTLTLGTLTIGANTTLSLQGSVSTGSGRIDATTNSTSVIAYNGSSAQTIAASTFTSSSISNLTINNNSGVTLSTPITITGNLVLTLGTLTTDATNLLTVNSTTTVPAGSNSSFVKGPMVLNLPANYSTAGAKNFPVGSGTNFYGMVLNSPIVGAAASAITVTAYNSGSGGSVNAPLGSINTSEYWSLAATGNFNGASSIKLSSTSGSANTAIAYSTTQSGAYSTLGGSGIGTPLTSTSAVPAGTSLYFALGLTPTSYTWTGAAADGDWTTPTNWNPSRTPATSDILVFDGSTATITSLPSAESIYRLTIKNGASLTLSSSAAATLSFTNSLSVDATSTLTESTNTSLTIASGTATINGIFNVNAGTYTSTGITTVSGSSALLQNGGGTFSTSATTLYFTSGATYTHSIAAGTIPTANWTSSGTSTVNITGATSASPAGMGQTFYNLTWDCAGQSSSYAFSSTPTINGTLTVKRTGVASVLSLIPSGFTYSIPTYVQNGGTVAIINSQASATARTFTVTGNFSIDNTIGTSLFYLDKNPTIAGGSGTLEVKGNFTAATGTSLLVSTGSGGTPTGNLLLDGTGNQTITAGSSTVLSSSSSPISVTINKSSGSLTLSSDFTVPGALTLTNGTLTIGAHSMNLQGSVSISSGRIDASNNNAILSLNAATTIAASTFSPATIANLVINNAAITLSQAVTVSNSLTLNSTTSSYNTITNGGNLTIGSNASITKSKTSTGNLYLASAPTFTSLSSNSFSYLGSVLDTVGNEMPSSANTITSLTINNSGNVNLKGYDITTSGALILTAGDLVTGNNFITASTVTGGNANSYVLINGTGGLKTSATSGVAKLYPVGTRLGFAPLTITPSTTQVYSVGLANALFVALPGDTTQVLKAQWHVLGTNASTTATIKFGFSAAQFSTGYTPTASELGIYQSAAWSIASSAKSVTPTNDSTTFYSLTATGLTIPTVDSNYYAIGNVGNVVVTQTQWTGTKSTDWSDYLNWTNNVPSATDSAVIVVTNKQPIITASQSVKNINIAVGATVTNNGTLNIISKLINSGTISGTGTTILNGNAAQTVSGTGVVGNLTLNNSNGATVSSGSNKLNITGVLTLQKGRLTTNGNVIMRSTSIANSGILAPYGASGNTGTISGNVTVERFIPKGFRSYRDLSAGGVFNVSNTLFNTWQESGSYANNGYGMFITGILDTIVKHNSVDVTTGLDHSLTGSPSAFYYKAGWDTVKNTRNELLNPYQSYRVLVRGDRSFDLDTTPVIAIAGPLVLAMNNSTALRASGSLITGNVVFSRTGVTNAVTGSTYNSAAYGLNPAANSYTYIANPYACPIDFKHIAISGLTNIHPYYYYLDPTIGSTGAWVVYNAVSDVSTKFGHSSNGEFIQAGQGFLIKDTSLGVPTLTITEADKSILSTSRTGVFGTTVSNSGLSINLMKLSGLSYRKMDAAVAVFGSQFSNGIGREDAGKMSNATDNLSIVESGKSLSIDARLPATTADVLPIGLGQLSGTNYQLVINSIDFARNGVAPFIKDAFTNKTIALTSGIDTIAFTADAKVAATYQNRFTVVFKPTTLSVNSIVATATANGSVATITWNTVGEKGVAKFEVEKSTDGTDFAKIGEESAKNTATASYSATDKDVVATTSYYRIKAISTDGTIAYSNIAKVITNYELGITLYPNPLVGKKLNIDFNTVNVGKYLVTITNVLGQKVTEQAIYHAGGNGTHSLNIDGTIAKGIYNVVISDVNSKEQVYKTSLSVQ